jgi:glycosyltransferase involved in cell wall biosynthesis
VRLVVVNPAPLDTFKGTERFLAKFGNHMVGRGHQVCYLSDSEFNHPRLKIQPDVNFDAIQVRFRRIGQYLHIPPSILVDLEPDVVYVNNFTQFPTLPLLGIPLILGTYTLGLEAYLRNDGSPTLSYRLKRPVLHALARTYFRRVRTIVHVLNSSQLRWISTLGFKDYDLRIIPLTVDEGVYHPLSTRDQDEGAFTVLYVGGIEADKGILVFLEVARILRSRFANEVRFRVVGAGTLDWLVELEAADHADIEFLGVLSEREKCEQYNAADVLVSPSKTENYHYVTAEAQICGLPVVSTNLSGPRDLILDGVTGLLVPIRDPTLFADAISRYFLLQRSNREAYTSLRSRISALSRRLYASEAPQILERVCIDLVGSGID